MMTMAADATIMVAPSPSSPSSSTDSSRAGIDGSVKSGGAMIVLSDASSCGASMRSWIDLAEMTRVFVPAGGSVGCADGGLMPVLFSMKATGDGFTVVVGSTSVEYVGGSMLFSSSSSEPNASTNRVLMAS